MRTLPKYVLFSCAAVGLAWTAVSVEVRGRTPYGHFLEAGGKSWVAGAQASWRSAKAAAEDRWGKMLDAEATSASPAEERRAPKRARPAAKPAPKPAVQEQSGAERRVALLRAADEKVAPKKEAPRKARTHLDGPTTKADRAALDRLVTGR